MQNMNKKSREKLLIEPCQNKNATYTGVYTEDLAIEILFTHRINQSIKRE